jgi:aryl-alcohol dehydrogenase-like predicted oxidoreductase
MLNRREFLGITTGAGLVLTPQLLHSLQQSSAHLIQRAIPSTGERLPVIGLSFSNHAGCADQAALKEVLKTFAGSGGRLFDATHASNPAAEQFHATAANELGLQNTVFWSLRGAPTGPAAAAAATDAAAAKAYVQMLLARHNVPKIDLIMMSPSVKPEYLAGLREEKTAGRVRHIGVQVISDGRFPELEAVMRNQPIDVIGVTYDVGSRLAEETILPLAQERKIGVIAFFPFSHNGGVSCGSGRNLFARVGDRPVPEWAAEFDARTWAQFFLKYVISHPAVTVARVGTSKTAHMLDNLSGGAGRLPNETTRKRMVALIDALPPIAR